MTPLEQLVGSQKYAARTYAFVPTPEGLVVLRCRGSQRDLIAVFDDSLQLMAFLEEDFAAALTENLERLERDAERARLAPGLSINWKDLDIDLKL
jgi:hypothetical protein